MAKRNTRRVNLQDLFRWKQELHVTDHNGEQVLTVYQRVVSDKEYEEARLHALRQSRKVRLALRDPETDEHAALMENLEVSSKQQITNVILINKFQQMHSAADDMVQIQMPKHPGTNASVEQMEEYEHAVDEYNQKRAEELMEHLDKIQQKEQEKLEELSNEELIELAAKSMENQICTNVVNEILRDYQVYLGTYADKAYKNRYFISFEDFQELASQVKEQLIRGYNSLKMVPEELKN